MDISTPSQHEERRFGKIYWFVCFFGFLTLAMIVAIVFFHIPKDNQQSANMALAFCMSAFTALSGYLVGASSDKKQQSGHHEVQTIIERKNDKIYKLIDKLKTESELNNLYATYSAELLDDSALKDYLEKAITNAK